MKTALVGVGYWGSKLLRVLARRLCPSDIVVVDEMSRLASVAREYRGVGLARALDEVLSDVDVEAVLIATPVTTHADLARAVIASGRHVFVEKPLAASVHDAEELAWMADAFDVRLMVGHTFLFSPRVDRIAEHLQRGEAGRVQYVTSARLNLGLHRSDVNVIWDLAPHDFSLIFHLLGEFPESVRTTAKGILRPDSPDVAFIDLTFPSGTIASVSVSWLAPRKVRNTVIVGDKAMIDYDDTRAEEPIKIYYKGLAETLDTAAFGANQLTYRYGDTVAPYVPVDEPLTREIDYFFSYIAGAAPLSDGWFGCEVVRALAAADRSWRDAGLPVYVGADEVDLTAIETARSLREPA